MVKPLLSQLQKYLYQERQRCENLAVVASQLQGDESAIRRMVPELLADGAVNHLVAGGGVWPEPFQFDPQRERSSFFWGRDHDGALTFYDDYNSSEGMGYHNEAWYVPAIFFPERPYWSRSYVDIFSNEPMVTCAIPYRDSNDAIAGVVTVDLRLDGLRDILSEHAKSFGGYIMALDRTNVLLSHPDPTAIRQEYHTGQLPSESPPVYYLTVSELAGRQPQLMQLSQYLEQVLIDLRSKVKDHDLVDQLDAASYQIDRSYASLAVSEYLYPTDEAVVTISDHAGPGTRS